MALLAAFKLFCQCLNKKDEALALIKTALKFENTLAYSLYAQYYNWESLAISAYGTPRRRTENGYVPLSTAEQAYYKQKEQAYYQEQAREQARNKEKAATLYTVAYEKGSVIAAYELGKHYQDLKKAKELFRIGSKKGYSPATLGLAHCYLEECDSEDGVGKQRLRAQAIVLCVRAINEDKFNRCLSTALHTLFSVFSISTTLPKLLAVSGAKICFIAYKKDPNLLEQIIKRIFELLLICYPNDFEILYWARFMGDFSCSTSQKLANKWHGDNPVTALIRENPDIFVNLLFKDDIQSDEEKLRLYKFIAANYLKKSFGLFGPETLSTENTFLLLHRMKFLPNLGSDKHNPASYLNLLPNNFIEECIVKLISKQEKIPESADIPTLKM